jgi:hypothetical protein
MNNGDKSMAEIKRGKENKSVLTEDDAMDQFME